MIHTKTRGRIPASKSVAFRWIAFMTLLLLLADFDASGSIATQHSESKRTLAPSRLRKAVACLVAADFVRQDDLKYLGLKVNDWAWVRLRIGSIPGIGDTPGTFNVVMYSSDPRKGMLLFANPNDRGGFEAILNAYHLYKHGSSWTADYGNGGYVTYEAIGRFVTTLSHDTRYRVHLLPGGAECTEDSK